MTSVLYSLLQVAPSLHGFSGQGLALLFEASLKGTLFLLLAVALALGLRRASAASRHLLWTLALGAMLALPIVSLTVPAWHVPILSSLVATAAGERTIRSENLAVVSPGPQVGTEPAAQRPATAAFAPASGPDWLGWILALWAIGLLLMVARIAGGEVRVRGFRRHSRLFETGQAKSILESVSRHLGISRPVELRTSAEIAIPFTWRSFRPIIFLPAEAEHWSGEQLEFVMAHELAHVSRYDYLSQMPAHVACGLFWFHPLVWLAAFQMRRERERACDDLVLSLGHPATDYAEFLLALGRRLRRLDIAWSTSVAMAQPSQLEVRMKALLDSKLNHRPLAASRVLFAAALAVALILPAAAMRATAESATGNISGTVHDPSGAVIPDAGVVLVNSRTQTRIATRTGEDGSFNFPAVPAGRYRLDFAKPGFARTQTGEFELKSSSDLHQNFTLDVGWVSEEVVVRGHRPSEAPAIAPHAPRRIRVGGLVQAAKLVKMAKPIYPANAEKQGIEGTVILRAVIGTSGQILSLAPYNGADPALTKAAMDAVRQWQYQPTLLNGVPVEVATTITIVFRLDQ